MAVDQVNEDDEGCEEALDNCEDARISYRYLLSVCVIIIILLGSLLVYLNLSYDEDGEGFDDLTVYYLIPPRCLDCDTSIVDDISYELGIDIPVVESDSVQRPNIFVVHGNLSTLGLANSKLNMLSLLCEFAGVDESCDLREADISSSVECLNNYNISGDTIVFYKQGDCAYCSEMTQWIREIRQKGYVFYQIDVDDEDERVIAEECLADILDLEGVVPQFACAAKGRSKSGAFTSIEELEFFAENCRKA